MFSVFTDWVKLPLACLLFIYLFFGGLQSRESQIANSLFECETLDQEAVKSVSQALLAQEMCVG